MYPDDAFARFMSYNRWHHPRLAYRSTVPRPADYPDKPYRPSWLSPEAALDCREVLKNLRGFISWGSPLEMFARTWPAMVHLRSDSHLSQKFEWINLYDPVDVVASKLSSYWNIRPEYRPINFACRSSLLVLSAHTSYLMANERRLEGRISPALIRWMLQSDTNFIGVADQEGLQPLNPSQIALRRVVAGLQWILVLIVGLLTWPICTGLLFGIVSYLPRRIANFIVGEIQRINGESFDIRVPSNIDTFFKNIDDTIASYQPTLSPSDDIKKIAAILTIVSGFILIGSALHYIFDSLSANYAKIDRATGNRDIATADFPDVDGVPQS